MGKKVWGFNLYQNVSSSITHKELWLEINDKGLVKGLRDADQNHSWTKRPKCVAEEKKGKIFSCKKLFLKFQILHHNFLIIKGALLKLISPAFLALGLVQSAFNQMLGFLGNGCQCIWMCGFFCRRPETLSRN